MIFTKLNSRGISAYTLLW